MSNYLWCCDILTNVYQKTTLLYNVSCNNVFIKMAFRLAQSNCRPIFINSLTSSMSMIMKFGLEAVFLPCGIPNPARGVPHDAKGAYNPINKITPIPFKHADGIELKDAVGL